MGWDKSKTDPLQWAAKMKDAPRDAINKFAFEVFKRVVTKTPLDTGAARQNWLVSVNSPRQEIVDGSSNPLAEGQKVIKAAEGDDSIYITNNLPYIRKLEYGGYGHWEGKTFIPANGDKTVSGFSSQAPHGMVGCVISEADRLWDAAVKATTGGTK